MSEKQIRSSQNSNWSGTATLNIHDECRVKYELLRGQLSVAMEALDKVNGPYEIEWADKSRLRDFINNQKGIAKQALEKIKGMANEKEKDET